jgi:hypothetical protein
VFTVDQFAVSPRRGSFFDPTANILAVVIIDFEPGGGDVAGDLVAVAEAFEEIAAVHQRHGKAIADIRSAVKALGWRCREDRRRRGRLPHNINSNLDIGVLK